MKKLRNVKLVYGEIETFEIGIDLKYRNTYLVGKFTFKVRTLLGVAN